MIRALCAFVLFAIVAAAQPIGGGTSVIACVGSPGNTVGTYRQQCQTSGNAVYACGNSSGCAVAADWASVTGSGSFTYPSGSGVVQVAGGAWGSTLSLQGTDTKVLTAGTVSGSAQALCTDSNGGATTTGCPSGGGVTLGAICSISSAITGGVTFDASSAANSGCAVTASCDGTAGCYTVFTASQSGNVTLTLANFHVGQVSMQITQGGSGSYTISCSSCSPNPNTNWVGTFGNANQLFGVWNGTAYQIAVQSNSQGFTVYSAGIQPTAAPSSGAICWINATTLMPNCVNPSTTFSTGTITAGRGTYTLALESAPGDGNVVSYIGNDGTQHRASPYPAANTTVAVSGGTQGANSCSSTTNVTMTGVGVSNVLLAGYSSNPSSLTGWGSTGGMVFQIWPSAANTGTWQVCNQTTSSITYSAITMNVGAH